MAPIQPGPTTGATLPPQTIALWAQNAGFSGEDLVIAVAVALAESGGRTTEKPTNANGTTDYGVWQINSVHRALFDRYPTWWGEDNARMAYEVFKSSGWRAWTVYRSGAYERHMETARQAAGAPGNPTGDPNPETTREAQWFQEFKGIAAAAANALLGIAQAVFKGGAWLAKPENWVRVAYVTVGGALVVGALVLVSKPSISSAVKTVQAVKKVAV